MDTQSNQSDNVSSPSSHYSANKEMGQSDSFSFRSKSPGLVASSLNAASSSSLRSAHKADLPKPKMNLSNAPPGTRVSMMSHYSGIIQDADTDTIRYVVDPANAEKSTVVPSFVTTRKTSIAGMSAHTDVSDHTERARHSVLSTGTTERGYESPVADTEPLLLETVAPQTSRPPDRKQVTDLEISIPARSAKRPQSAASPVLEPNENDELLRRLSMLSAQEKDDAVLDLDAPTRPLSRADGRPHSRTPSWVPPVKPAFSSVSSFDNDIQSFHTAELAATHDDARSLSSGTSRGTSKEPVTPKMSADEFEDITIEPMPKKSTNKKKKKKRGSSGSRPNSFSYDTLARLLSATDGVVIGQEFAHLGLPNHEKFLLEQVVDSLGRLSAGMFINPSRYDQGCKRLQRVLDILEGFEDNS